MRMQLRAALAFFVLVTVPSARCGKKGSIPVAPPAVAVVQVRQKDVPITKEWVAELDGFVNVQIRAQARRQPLYPN